MVLKMTIRLALHRLKRFKVNARPIQRLFNRVVRQIFSRQPKPEAGLTIS